MKLFDIIGPVMIGPSSSHTAGAVRIGLVARKLLSEAPVIADIGLHGSFAMTGSGHGTDRALVAGLLGIQPDNSQIPHSFELAEQAGLTFSIHSIHIPNVHPNSTRLRLIGEHGRKLEVIASSLGGGRILIASIDGIQANFSGNENTLIVHATVDQPGSLAEVTSLLAQHHINIANMQLYRHFKGGQAVMIIECDDQISQSLIAQLSENKLFLKVTYLNKEQE